MHKEAILNAVLYLSCLRLHVTLNVIAKRHDLVRQQSIDGTCFEIKQEYFEIIQE